MTNGWVGSIIIDVMNLGITEGRGGTGQFSANWSGSVELVFCHFNEVYNLKLLKS